jgi:O-antigen ligase
VILLPLLCYAVLVIWLEERGAWSVFQIGIFVLAALRLLRKDPWSVSAPFAVLACATAWPFLQVAAGASVSPGQTWYAVLDWLTFLLVFALAAEVDAERFLRPVSTFGLLLSATAILQQCSSGGRIFWIFSSGYADNVLGPFVNRNQYSAWIELLIPVALYLAFTDRRRRWLHGTSAAVMFSSVIAGGSRAGMALAAAEVLAALLLLAKRRTLPPKRFVVAVCHFLVLAAVASVVASWQNLQAGLHRGSAEALRMDALKASLQMVRVHPWIGWGLGSWPEVYPRYAGFDSGLYLNQAHNDWAQWAAEGGLPFAALMIVFAGLLWKRAWRSIYGVGTIAFLLHALVDYPMQQRPALGAWFFAMAGVAFHNRQRGATNNGLLRRVRHLTNSLGSRDTAVLQKASTAGSPGPLQRSRPADARRTPDEAPQRNSGNSPRPNTKTAIRCGPHW